MEKKQKTEKAETQAPAVPDKPEQEISLEPVAEIKGAFIAKVAGKHVVVCFHERNRGNAEARFNSVTAAPERNVLRALHATGKKVGLHALRRFRTETLRRARVPHDLERFWLGHAKAKSLKLRDAKSENQSWQILRRVLRE